jgi:hypothetical protein
MGRVCPFANLPIQAPEHGRQLDPEDPAGPNQSFGRNRPSCLDLLPVPSRKTEPDHVLLSKAVPNPLLS